MTEYLIKPIFCKSIESRSGNLIYTYGSYITIQASIQYHRVFVKLGEHWSVLEKK